MRNQESEHRFFRRFLPAAVCCCLVFPGAAFGVNRALIVGVGYYENLPDDLQLAGPFNDAERVVDLLQRRKFNTRDIAVLANCPDREANRCARRYPTPNRANILAAFDKLTDSTNRGDFVFLYFAGHGSQQPGHIVGQELDDGLDEIFLPSDIGRWNGEAGRVANAIVDDELAAQMARLRNKGAFVWAVFDSCHAGTMLRAAGVASEHDRRLRPVDDLGIPASMFVRIVRHLNEQLATNGWMPRRAALSGENIEHLAADAGDYVAFYAAQPAEMTPELRLPVSNEPRQPHGLFTYTLMNVLEAYPHASYRQVLEQVVARYDSMNRSRPTPMFEGSALDAAVFDNQTARSTGPTRRQWRLERDGEHLAINAGTLHELTAGAELLIVSQPADSDAAAVGKVTVTKAELMYSTLTPVPWNDAPSFDSQTVVSSSYARLLTNHRLHRLKVGRPRVGLRIDSWQRTLDKVLTELSSDTDLRIDWVAPDEPADVYLLVEPGVVWLLPPSGEFVRSGPNQTPSVPLNIDPLNMRHALQAALQRISRVVELLRLANDPAAAGALLDVRMLVRDPGTDDRSPAYQPVSGPNSRPNLAVGDEIRFEFVNTTTAAVDFTALLLDAAWGISIVYPTPRNPDNRLAPERRHEIDATITSETAGTERLLVIATAAAPGHRTDFRYLEQPGIKSVEGFTRGRADAEPGRRADEARRRGASMQLISWHTIQKSGDPVRSTLENND